MLTVADVAAICHEAWRELRYAQGGWTPAHWWASPQATRDNAVWSVRDRLLNGTDLPDAHNRWVANYAPKDHPNAKPFDQLSQDAQAHGYLFSSIVEGLRGNTEQVMTEEQRTEECLA